MKQKKFAGNNSTETQSQQTGVKDSETSRLSPATARTYASKANKGK